MNLGESAFLTPLGISRRLGGGVGGESDLPSFHLLPFPPPPSLRFPLSEEEEEGGKGKIRRKV